MKKKIEDYSTLVFDCDGVVLNSNKIKNEAFLKAALPYGDAAANALVAYHVQHGGISRYKKFAYFLDHIVCGKKGPSLDALLESYASYIKNALQHCDVEPSLKELREKTASSNWLIVSGGDQHELRELFAARGLDHFFDGGIYGSPDTKDEILYRNLSSGNINESALLIGDSKYDHVAASTAGLDFLFVSQWTEFAGWKEYCEVNMITHVESLFNLI